MPAMFWRGVLCVKGVGTALRSYHCGDPAHFDVLAHHPYSVGPPDTPAVNADDVSIPDMGKLSAILRAAERGGTALPDVRHELWATETGYNTKPPNPNGIPAREAARWMDETLEILASEGVSLVTFDTIVDQPPDPSYSDTSQSGIFYLDGRPKPTVAAFRFPFVATRRGEVADLWGSAPQTGVVHVELRDANNWVTKVSLRVRAGYTFVAHLVDSRAMTIRAKLGSLVSIPWRLQ